MQKIKVEIIINSDIKKVWKHWNASESIKAWAFADETWECPYAENDLRAQGRFLTRMRAKDLSASFDFTGTYIAVEEFKNIKYLMDKLENEDKNRECVVIFEKLEDNKTKITETFDPENINSLDLQKSGWQSILENFKKFVESF